MIINKEMLKSKYTNALRPFYLLLFLVNINFSNADSLFVFNNTQVISQLSGLYYYNDASGKRTADEVFKKNAFVLNTQAVTNLGISNSVFWIKLKAIHIKTFI